jgi:uncharacterized protein YbdZ (MbtH family)
MACTDSYELRDSSAVSSENPLRNDIDTEESGMANPFDDTEAMFLVLLNDEGQYSIWPGFADVPDGWDVVSGPADKASCVQFIDEKWTDMRPVSIR